MSVKGFSSFSFGGYSVPPSGTIVAILVEGHEEHFCEIIFNWITGSGGDVVYFFFYL